MARFSSWLLAVCLCLCLGICLSGNALPASAAPLHRLQAHLTSDKALQPELSAHAEGTSAHALMESESDAALAVGVDAIGQGLNDIIAQCRNPAHLCGPGHLRDLLDEWEDPNSALRTGERDRKAVKAKWATLSPIQQQAEWNTMNLAGVPLPPVLAAPNGQQLTPTTEEIEARVAAVVTGRQYTGTVPVPGYDSQKKAETKNRFTYTFGAGGEIRSVTGFVREGQKSDPKVKDYCHQLYHVAFGVPDRGPAKSGKAQVTIDGKAKRWVDKRYNADTATWAPYDVASNMDADIDDGHIVAAKLGGSNDRKINFFPQTGTSNRFPTGPWTLAENLADDKRRELETFKSIEGTCVSITIQFNYGKGAATLTNSIPKSGTYTVTWDANCSSTKLGPHVADWRSQTFKWTNAVPNHTLVKMPLDENIDSAEAKRRTII